MKTTTLSGVVAAAAVLAIGGAFYANAGDLNPPAGPVGSTMVTLEDIHDAIRGGEATEGDRTYYMQVAGIAGESGSVPGLPSGSIRVDDLSLSLIAPPLLPDVPGALQKPSVIVMIPFDTTAPQFYLQMAFGQALADVVIQQYREIGGPAPVLVQEWTLKSVLVEDFEVRAEGTTSGTARVAFTPRELCMKSRVVNPNGTLGQYQSFCWDFRTLSTCTCP